MSHPRLLKRGSVYHFRVRIPKDPVASTGKPKCDMLCDLPISRSKRPSCQPRSHSGRTKRRIPNSRSAGCQNPPIL